MISFVKIKVMSLKTLAMVVTLALVIFYDNLPKRSMNLHPHLTQSYDESIDSDIGGNSKITWVDTEQFNWICHLNSGTAYPYCGISLLWSEPPFTQLDLSKYEEIEVDLDYIGQATYLRVFIRNYYPLPGMTDPIGVAKFNSLSKVATAFKDTVTIPFRDLRVADWWIDNNKIPPENIHIDIRNVIAIGVDIPYPNTLGEHQFKLNSIKATGNFLSKESLYLSIILFWSVLLITEMLIRQTKLRSEVQLSGEQLRELKTKSDIYQEKAEHDKLTGILNREGLNRIVEDLYATKSLTSYALLVLDLDFFKRINDKHGHVVGDNVLQETATIFKTHVRSYDIVSRWGGEEFVILFHCLDDDSILPFAEKIRRAIESTSFVNGKIDKLTVSIGATKISHSELFENAFIRADKALYEAKDTGRNKTIVNL